MAEMRRFHLVRTHDVSGVSGVGIVASGVQAPDGEVVVRWHGEFRSWVFHRNIEAVVAVHGHGGATTVEWIDPEMPA